MSQSHETSSTVQEMASRLRGNGQAEQEGPVGAPLRANSHFYEGQMVGPSSAQGVAPNHQPPQAAHPPAQAPSPQELTWEWAHSKPLTPQQVKRGLLELVQKMGSDKSVVPKDLFDFMGRAQLILLDENNNPVTYSRAIVAWEEK